MYLRAAKALKERVPPTERILNSESTKFSTSQATPGRKHFLHILLDYKAIGQSTVKFHDEEKRNKDPRISSEWVIRRSLRRKALARP